MAIRHQVILLGWSLRLLFTQLGVAGEHEIMFQKKRWLLLRPEKIPHFMQFRKRGINTKNA